jgi:hypothetical protein
MLAIVEDEEHMTGLERQDEALDYGAFATLRDTECPSNSWQHEVGITQRSQVNERPTVIEIGDHIVGNCNGQARLADATGTGQRQERDPVIQ